MNNILDEPFLLFHMPGKDFEDLDLIYWDKTYEKVDPATCAHKVLDAVRQYKTILLIGDGSGMGLKADEHRLILNRVNSFYFRQFNQTIIGIFKGATEFARFSGFTGLFLGDVVFDTEGALKNYSSMSQKELDDHRYEWCLDLSNSIRNYPLKEVPGRMIEIGKTHPEGLRRYNYSSLSYLDFGRAQNPYTYSRTP